MVRDRQYGDLYKMPKRTMVERPPKFNTYYIYIYIFFFFYNKLYISYISIFILCNYVDVVDIYIYTDTVVVDCYSCM